MPDVFKTAEILVSHAVRVHKDEIAIIAYYGSHAKGIASETSDLDIFYIPNDGKADSLCTQFVLDGLPYDFWPVSWGLAEDIANARRNWGVAASLVADAKVLYHRSQADLDRFNGLKKRIEELMGHDERKTMVERALDEFKNTLFQLEQVRLAISAGDTEGTHWAAIKFVNIAINCLALLNQRYFSKGWGAYMAEVLDLPQKPDGLEETVKGILMPRDLESMLDLADTLARQVREILIAAKSELYQPCDPKDAFRDFYFFIFEYVNKVLSACKRADAIAAQATAFSLQEEICQQMNRVEKGFCGTDFNLLGEYSHAYYKAGFPDLLEPASTGDLIELARRVRLLDDKAKQWLQSNSVDLGILTDEDHLRRFLDQRDPA